MALLLAMAGCSSSDPTTSDEYAALEQELAEANQDLAQTEVLLTEVTAERDALVVSEAEAAAPVPEAIDATTVPDEIAALLVEWGEAVNRGDGSVIELYGPAGYHMHGNQRIDHDDVVSHLQVGGVTGEWTTEPLLLLDNGEGRYVVVIGARNTSIGGAVAYGSVTFRIRTTASGELEIAETAWKVAS
jgi:hypothetical protein